MESPYYEMTHDFEEENRLFQSGYVKGYHDAVMQYPEIVRCKECKYLIDHYGFMDDGYCENMRETYGLKFKPEDDWFCADGKRKEMA